MNPGEKELSNIDPDIKAKSFNKLNAFFGSDITKLQMCNELYDRLSTEKASIELKISQLPDELNSVNEDLQKISSDLNELKLGYESSVNQLNEKENDKPSIIEQLLTYKNDLESLQKSLQYLERLQFVDNTCNELASLLNQRNYEKCAEHYKSLCTSVQELSRSRYSYLINYLKSCISSWHNVLKHKLCDDYRNVLKELKWPFIPIGNMSIEQPSITQKPNFQRLTTLLLRIQLPEEMNHPKSDSVLLINFAPLSISIMELLSPFEKRFQYHFCTKKPTNRLDKPEWMFTQILKWIKDHEAFLHEWVQPVFENVFKSLPNSAKFEFIVGLVEIVAKKLQNDFTQLLSNDLLFSHAVDETLSFHRELIKIYDYPSSYPSVLSVLTSPQVFIKWTNMERKFAREKMDDLISMKTAWDILFENDKCKVTECADFFVTLLIVINSRYISLPQPGHRLQFLEVQLELIDDFRIRLLQLLHEERSDPLNSKLTNILNTVHYLVSVLNEWSNNTDFIMLHHYKKQIDPEFITENSVSVFDESLYLMGRIIDELLELINETVILEVKAKSRSYRNDRWHAMPAWSTILYPTLTPSACPMFIVLTNSLHKLYTLLSPDLFRISWETIASELTKMIIEEVVLENTFNDGGAQQLHFDIRRNLLPLFSQYTSKPEAYFLPLLETCSLLCLDKSFTIDSLPINICHLRKESVKAILDRRIEWSSLPTLD